jgi:phosphonate transport system permease protein
MARKTKTVSSRREPRPPLAPPPVAAIASLIIPGLGQILARSVQRGLLLFGSLAAIVAMLGWRIKLLAHLEPTPAAMLARALERRPFFIGLIIACLVVLWLWNAWDARRQAAQQQPGGFGIFALVLFTFFALGWQISEIDIYKMIREFPDATKPFSRVIWPWKAAVEREPILVTASAEIMVPCGPDLPPIPQEEPGQPYLKAEPNCGVLSRWDENNQLVPGTVTHLTGKNFQPDTGIEIWWSDPLGNDFQVRQAGQYLTVTSDDSGSFELDLVLPYRLIPPTAAEYQIHEVEARQLIDKGELHVSEPLLLTIERMV